MWAACGQRKRVNLENILSLEHDPHSVVDTMNGIYFGGGRNDDDQPAGYVGMVQRTGGARRHEGEYRAPSSRAAESEKEFYTQVSTDVVQFVMVSKIKYLDRALLHFAEAVWTQLLGTQMKCAAQALLCRVPRTISSPSKSTSLFPATKLGLRTALS